MRNYIQIEPPFDTVAGDRTDYGAVLAFLRRSNVTRGGGARELANTVNIRKQSGGRKTKRKSSNVHFRRRKTKRK